MITLMRDWASLDVFGVVLWAAAVELRILLRTLRDGVER